MKTRIFLFSSVYRKARRRVLVSVLFLLTLLSLLLSDCEKSQPQAASTQNTTGSTELIVVLESKLYPGDSVYYSINLPCLAPHAKTGYFNGTKMTWKCSSKPTGALYNFSAQGSGSLINPDSLRLEVWVNGSLKASSENINFVGATIHF